MIVRNNKTGYKYNFDIEKFIETQENCIEDYDYVDGSKTDKEQFKAFKKKVRLKQHDSQEIESVLLG